MRWAGEGEGWVRAGLAFGASGLEWIHHLFPVQDEGRAAVHHPNSLGCQGWDEPGLHLPPGLSAGECDGGLSRADAWHWWGSAPHRAGDPTSLSARVTDGRSAMTSCLIRAGVGRLLTSFQVFLHKKSQKGSAINLCQWVLLKIWGC